MRYALAILLAGAVASPVAAEGPGPRKAVVKQSTWRVDYPSEAVRKEQEGRVTFVLSIDDTGVVTNCVVTVSSGHPLLDQAACRTGRNARFEPALDASGAPVASTLETTSVYDLH